MSAKWSFGSFLLFRGEFLVCKISGNKPFLTRFVSRLEIVVHCPMTDFIFSKQRWVSLLESMLSRNKAWNEVSYWTVYSSFNCSLTNDYSESLITRAEIQNFWHLYLTVQQHYIQNETKEKYHSQRNQNMCGLLQIHILCIMLSITKMSHMLTHTFSVT